MKNTPPSPDYLPIQQFYQNLSQRDSPYQCQLSFAPLFKKIKENSTQVEGLLSEKVTQLVDEIEQELATMTDADYLTKHPKKIEQLLQFLFPNLFLVERLGFIKVPFANAFVHITAGMRELLESPDWEIKLPSFTGKVLNQANANLDIAHLILQIFYGIDLDLVSQEVLTFRNKKTNLWKFYKINIIQDFVEGKALQPLEKLSDKLLFKLVNNFDDAALWQQHLPPEHFAFEGFVIGYLSDITEGEVLKKVKAILFDENYETDHNEHLRHLELLTRSFMNMPDLKLGILRTTWSFWQENTSWALLRKFEKEVMFPAFKDEKGSYGKLIKNNEFVIVPDLTKKKHRCKIEEKLVEMGMKSLLIAPFFDSKNELSGIFEIAAPTAFAFNRFTYLRLRNLIEVFGQGTNKFLADLDYHERETMQAEFTTIHPSVEWRFREVASKLFWQRMIEGQNAAIEPIIFKDLYPMYAQADIVKSSTLRNESIQIDLKDNLQRAIALIKSCRQQIDFHLLEIYLIQAEQSLAHLEKGAFISSDETKITELITQEIHPLFKELQQRFSDILAKEISQYFDYIHPQLNIVYRQRKAYDDSVRTLNQTIGNYIDEEDAKMQKILPHHFEKFTTDGVEYNIYLGNSLLPEGGFSPFFLKNFRLWQLVKMCEVTRLVAKTSRQLPMPLQTAQLIFVYNNTLSIQFKMEEKQFDVDGTYNVRYEILKKRIDKAVVKGTNERLTIAGKIAIVWLQKKDRLEYLEYLEYLQSQQYIDGEVEELVLEKLQGADGLRALRFSVRV